MYLKIKQVIQPGSKYRWATYGSFDRITYNTEPHTENITRNIDEALIYDQNIDWSEEDKGPCPCYHIHLKNGGTTWTLGVNVEDAYLLNEQGTTMEHLCFAVGPRKK